MILSENNVFFVMGVSGVGKSTIGNLLSKELGIPFFDGDDFHPKENILKMSKGEPLNDEDRFGWLATLNKLAKDQLKENSCVIVCSALKNKYREILSNGVENNTKWIHLVGSYELISERMKQRSNHFMPTGLLKSQKDILENPVNAINVNISLTPLEIVEVIKKELNPKSEFGLFGLGVMGKSLSRNLASKNIKLSIFNRHVDGIEEDVAINFKNEFEELATTKAFDNVEQFVNSLQQPRKIMLMVNAGKTTDIVIESLIPYLSDGDILIDGGNSNYNETKIRLDYLLSKNIHLIGTGVSGGEEGALKGPSIMPSGDKEVYKTVAPFLNAIAAKDANNLPCCTYVGKEGSGHFVKMVHNGIEYVEMQLLAEVVNILKLSGNNYDEIADILESWKSAADSYLLEITVKILRKKEGSDWLVEKIMDKAGNKGTGNWTTIATAELGIPSTLIPAALFARYSSFYKEDRVKLNRIYDDGNTSSLNLTTEDILKAYQFARIINHFQGINLISEASIKYEWELNLSEIARIWTNGCIIKSNLMVELVAVLKETSNLLGYEKFVQKIKKLKPSTNKVVSQCVLNEMAIPCLSESVNFFNGHTIANSPANIIQAQRDYFGAHTYQRIDDPSGEFYHTNWK
ncbi:NADP-dependent phosphogluconate dehydrogenase [Lutibacter flavus]|uniref:6-phosphogluconate dehydrogenase, decarboxylating n=1 Tax=Lutibacter flavus TaxID=691689 RepID=A0A238VHE7_9FLAO|nr:NADP-dependent phosphogluconate dehydrogenase [Lutibacter flavus]SNR32929.1 6-phosphogluconate dehydrogenase [Lutibacter flavus]